MVVVPIPRYKRLQREYTMQDVEQVLAANAAFYAAFAAKDADAMAALWAHRAAVACIHPGWHPLRGRDAVLASWRSILGGPGSPPITCSDADAHVYGDSAFVICIEHIPAVELIATNVFVREDGAWRMVHHHASSFARAVAMERDPEEEEPDPGSGTLH
jgi:ketosteroid isomerase-like protein